MILPALSSQPSSPTKRGNPYLTPRSSQSDSEVDPTLQSSCNDDWPVGDETQENRLVFEFNAGLSNDCNDSSSLRSFLAAKFHCKPLKRLVENKVPVVTKKTKVAKVLKETDKRKKLNKKAINDPTSLKENMENSLSSISDANNDPLVLKLAVPIKKARRKKTQLSVAHPLCIDKKDAMTSMEVQTSVNLQDFKTSIDDLLTSTFIDDLSVNDFKDSIHDTNVEDSMDIEKEHSDFRVERSFQAQGT
jgi:hypothetical protein